MYRCIFQKRPRYSIYLVSFFCWISENIKKYPLIFFFPRKYIDTLPAFLPHPASVMLVKKNNHFQLSEL